jgi:hypothetical protein
MSAPKPTSMPEMHSVAAEHIGREGIVTVWDHQGRYLGCMGVETWIRMLTPDATFDPPTGFVAPNVHTDGPFV